MTRPRLLTTAQAALAVGRTSATIRDWHRRGLLTSHGQHAERWSIGQVEAVDTRLRSRKIAGHHLRLKAALRDTLPAIVDDIIDRPHDYGVSVVSSDPTDYRSETA